MPIGLYCARIGVFCCYYRPVIIAVVRIAVPQLIGSFDFNVKILRSSDQDQRFTHRLAFSSMNGRNIRRFIRDRSRLLMSVSCACLVIFCLDVVLCKRVKTAFNLHIARRP